MKIKHHTITPEYWAQQQIEYSWQEGMEAFLKRKPPSKADLIVEIKTYNWFERVILQQILGNTLYAILMSIGPMLIIISFIMLLSTLLQ